jgi:hypothetical protein
MSFTHRFSFVSIDQEAMRMRDVGLDVHLDFCEVAIWENGTARSAGRVETTPERLELFAESLEPDDRVALEVTANSWEIARKPSGAPSNSRLLAATPAASARPRWVVRIGHPPQRGRASWRQLGPNPNRNCAVPVVAALV